jgi:glycosyltransferase involved in cell wall biosynthesis
LHSIGKRVTVSMITMNEEAAVAIVIKNIQKNLPDAEILIVDSSQDNTAKIAEALGARVIRQFPPRGYGPAMNQALRESTRDVVITMDCDNTYPTEQISQFSSLVLENGYDLVDGSRLEKKPNAMPWINYLANVFFAWMASILFFRKLTDLHSGMRAYRKSMIDALTFQTQGDALPVELLLKPLLMGYKVHCIFIDYHERIGTSTMRPLHSAWWTVKRMLKIRLLT